MANPKEQAGKDILVIGSDEYRLWLHPVVLGTGKRLFREGSPMTRLKLVEATTTGSGLVILGYEGV